MLKGFVHPTTPSLKHYACSRYTTSPPFIMRMRVKARIMLCKLQPCKESLPWIVSRRLPPDCEPLAWLTITKWPNLKEIGQRLPYPINNLFYIVGKCFWKVGIQFLTWRWSHYSHTKRYEFLKVHQIDWDTTPCQYIIYVAPCTRHRWQMHMAYGHGLNEGWSLFYAHFLYNGSRLESTSLSTTRITHFDTWLESPLSNFIYYQMCHPPLAKGLKEIQGIYIMKWQKWSDSR